MTFISIRHLVVGLCMLAVVGLSVAIEPPKTRKATVSLEQMVPRSFAEWELDAGGKVLVANPQVEAGLAVTYDEVLSRTYRNAKGDRIMLSIAYTGDIDRQMDVHRPEFCYPAQGFDIIRRTADRRIETAVGVLPVKQLVTRQGLRVEPITYWITVGDTPTSRGWERKLVKLRYGLTGKIPAGMLVRVSNISANESAAYRLQQEFISALLSALPDKDRRQFVGTL
jgi:EpsI family protein